MGKISWKGGTLLSPVPVVLVSCSDGEKSNVFTAAWTGIICSDPPKLYISVRPERRSHEIIEKSLEFCVNMPPSSLVRAVDTCGVRSGRDCDKFRLAGLTPEKSFSVSCPSVAECPVTLECRVSEIKKLGSHDMFIADIVSVSVDEKLIDEKNRLTLEKASLMAYSHGQYFALGRKIGYFGFSVRKKRGSR